MKLCYLVKTKPCSPSLAHSVGLEELEDDGKRNGAFLKCLPLNTILKARLGRDAQVEKLIQVSSVISEELKTVWLNRAVSTCLKNKT